MDLVLVEMLFVLDTVICSFAPDISFEPTVIIHRLKKFARKQIGETGASCYNFQLKSLFVKSMLYALFSSTYTLHFLFVLMDCTKPLTFHIVVRQISEVSQALSTVTTRHVSGASCYITRGPLLQQRTCGSQSKCHSYM